MKRLELIGARFGRLVVQQFAGTTHDGRTTWHCLCDCGGTIVARANHLKDGDTRSCGCVLCEHARFNAKTLIHIHGETNENRTIEYEAWISMKGRCGNPNATGFKNYGGRGIIVCERWLKSYLAFLADMGRRPSPGHSIDRIDNDGNYEPGNVRWATRHEQNKNKRPSVPKGTKRKKHP